MPITTPPPHPPPPEHISSSHLHSRLLIYKGSSNAIPFFPHTTLSSVLRTPLYQLDVRMRWPLPKIDYLDECACLVCSLASTSMCESVREESNNMDRLVPTSTFPADAAMTHHHLPSMLPAITHCVVPSVLLHSVYKSSSKLHFFPHTHTEPSSVLKMGRKHSCVCGGLSLKLVESGADVRLVVQQST